MSIDKNKMATIEAVSMAISEYSDSRNKIIELGKDSILNAFQLIFDLIPNIKSVCWIQYTPYFNDGDVCKFSVGDLFFNTASIASEDENKNLFFYGEGDCDQFTRYDLIDNYSSNTFLASILDFLRNIIYSEEFSKDIFGDHVSIYINVGDKDFTIEEYSHD